MYKYQKYLPPRVEDAMHSIDAVSVSLRAQNAGNTRLEESSK